MINGFSNAQVIAALAGFIVASYVAFFGWLVSSLTRLDRKIDQRCDGLETKLGARIDALDNNSARGSKGSTASLAPSSTHSPSPSRAWGAVYHGLPEPRAAE